MLEQKVEEEKKKLLETNDKFKKAFLENFIFDQNQKLRVGMKNQ